MKTIITSIFSCLKLFTFAQVPDSIKKEEKAPVVYIKGHRDKKNVDIDFLRAGFQLELSDSSYTIKQFRLHWDDRKGDLNIIVLKGDSVNLFRNKNKNLHLNSLIAFDDIVVLKNGREFRLPSFYIHAEDVFKKYPTLLNPKICHTSNGQFRCFNDGTFLIQFDKNRFTGFMTIDSMVSYFPKEKMVHIKNPAEPDSLDLISTIQLQENSLIIRQGLFYKRIDSIHNTELNLNGFNIKLFPSGTYKDSIIFSTGDKTFLLEIYHFFSKKWKWYISLRQYNSLIYIPYDFRNNRVAFISIRDEQLGFGMSISTRFKTRKGIWYIKSGNYEEREQILKGVKLPSSTIPSYYYKYNRFGKLKTKLTKRKIEYCDCVKTY